MIVRVNSRRRATFGLGFLIVQIALVTVAVATTSQRLRTWDAKLDLPPLRNNPPIVRPLYDRPRVVTDEQLNDVLYKLRPRLRGPNPKINHVDHALRFWGLDADFDDPECLSGREMRELLVNHNVFTEAWGADAKPLLNVSRSGVWVRMQEGRATASHVDHTLAGLAEVGTPLDYPLQTPTGPLTVQALLERALRTFSLNQLEYEWSALAFALYMQPVERWYSKEGQEITFDRLAERIMRQELNQGVCMGHHRLHTLVMLLRLDEQGLQIISPQTREAIVAHLQDATAHLVSSQHEDGYWLFSWPEGRPPNDTDDDTQAKRILATGHALEWWALAPESVQPPHETVVRAGQWLSRTIMQMSDETIADSYTYLTHAGRALALWRGKFPAELVVRENVNDAR